MVGASQTPVEPSSSPSSLHIPQVGVKARELTLVGLLLYSR